MTSPSLRKLQITQLSTLLPSSCSCRGAWFRRCCLVAVGLLIVLGPQASSPAAAGKKRREASLEELRERNPSERWRLLQKTWRPLDSTPQPVAGAAATEPAAPAAPPSENEVVTSPDFPAREPSPPDQSSAVAAPAQIPAPKQTLPVWFIDEAQNADPQHTKRSAPATISTSHRQQPTPIQPASADAQPKPITSILPYYDYAPEDDSPCEFLCPQPENCPEADKSKRCPELVDLPHVGFESRAFAESNVTWEASNLLSNPLYFEDAALERYGHTHNQLVQPLFSLGKFGTQLVGLPYQMALHPICERRYALGWYRPGECAPYKFYLPPWNTKAAVTAGAAYTGLIFLIP